MLGFAKDMHRATPSQRASTFGCAFRRLCIPLIHAGDVAEAISRVIDKRATGPFNLAAEPPVGRRRQQPRSARGPCTSRPVCSELSWI